ncbi:adhesion G protein-coupled receptor E2-like [Dendronephthya gigantea]|uniref:adhesion G protein-coupled receptor E2-like n=1 Tax=Dendronephthya gigantea TaxID=151771 RepID=UPI00106ADB69|nr:adhesion G protein-coupled receptor E2-like [Dendronephthya gigantea]
MANSANNDCKTKSGQLARVTGGGLNNFLFREFIQKSSVWIGLTWRNGKWRYPDYSLSTYFNWNDNEPNNAQGNEYCVEYLTNGKWNDHSCDTTWPSICEKDIDECDLKTHSCHSQATCINTIGSYTCVCNEGFTGNGKFCHDKSECALNKHICHPQATCTNFIGSYTCTCYEGFLGNGSVCEDRNECALSNYICHPQATCTNFIGSYTCTCNEGFSGNGSVCEDKNECALNNYRCHSQATCKNTIGSYTCSCNAGFTGNGMICEDKNECALNNYRCHSQATCKNTIGSYTCTCNAGFRGNGMICEEKISNDETDRFTSLAEEEKPSACNKGEFRFKLIAIMDSNENA